MNNYFKLGIKDFYFEYLQSLLKTHMSKLFILENKFKEKYDLAVASVKEGYIQELENQLRLRDEIIKKQNYDSNNNYNNSEGLDEEGSVNINNNNSSRNVNLNNIKLKSIDQLKSEYSNKLPIIPLSSKKKMSSKKLMNEGISKIGNLPPIGGVASLGNINSILNDVKIMSNNINNNLNKIEKESNSNNHNSNYGVGKKDKNKLRAEVINNNVNRLNQARNYSQGIRNAYLNNNKESNNLIKNNNPNVNDISHLITNANNVSNLNNNNLNLNGNVHPSQNQSTANIKENQITNFLNTPTIKQISKNLSAKKSALCKIACSFQTVISLLK